MTIEIDGRYHEGISEADDRRDKELGTYNLTVIRFTEVEVLNDMFNVLRTFEAYLEDFKSRV